MNKQPKNRKTFSLEENNRNRKGEIRKDIFENKIYFPVILHLLKREEDIFTYNDIAHLIEQTTWTNNLRKELLGRQIRRYEQKVDDIDVKSPVSKQVYITEKSLGKIHGFIIKRNVLYDAVRNKFVEYFSENIQKTILALPQMRIYLKLRKKINYATEKKNVEKIARGLDDLSDIKYSILEFLNTLLYLEHDKKYLLEQELFNHSDNKELGDYAFLKHDTKTGELKKNVSYKDDSLIDENYFTEIFVINKLMEPFLKPILLKILPSIDKGKFPEKTAVFSLYFHKLTSNKKYKTAKQLFYDIVMEMAEDYESHDKEKNNLSHIAPEYHYLSYLYKKLILEEVCIQPFGYLEEK
jgi:hypothetical protein